MRRGGKEEERNWGEGWVVEREVERGTENNQVTFEWSFSKAMVDVNNTGVTKILWVIINLGMETSRSGGRRKAGLNHRAKPFRLNIGLGSAESRGHWTGQ